MYARLLAKAPVRQPVTFTRDPRRILPMTTPARNASLTALALLALAGGCTVGPDYKSRDTAMPEAWVSPLGGGETSEAASLATWWTNLSDPQLTSLVDRAVDGNLDLASYRSDFYMDANGLCTHLSGNSIYVSRIHHLDQWFRTG